MSKIGDKILDIIGLNNDEYDDEYEDEFEDEFDEIIEPKQTRFESKQKQKEKFSTFDDDEVDDKPLKKTVTKPSSGVSMEKQKSNFKPAPSKIVPMKATKASGLEVCVVRPSSFEDSREISDTLISGRAVILNLEGIHHEAAQRIIDFCSGSCYSINGNIQKISNFIFIVTPEYVDISGDFQELFGGIGNSNNSGFDIPL